MSHRRTIGVVTTSRADWGIYRPVLRSIRMWPDLALRLFVSGTHLSPEFGYTAKEITADGFTVDEPVEMLLCSDTPEGIAKSMGMGLIGFAQAFGRARPDLVLVLGDRFEMHAAALAALPAKIPVAHIHGGELTEGAIDQALRHSLTKLSHLHFVATAEYARRVIQLGEDPWRVTVSGAPALDNLRERELVDRATLLTRCGLRLQGTPPLLVTFHATTLQYERVEWQTAELLAALEALDWPAVFTMPNADTGGHAVRHLIRRYVETHAERAQVVENLGVECYFDLLPHVAAMVGNSSSGIIEAASFHLPVVNIGTRQRGRVRTRNVIDVGHDRAEIVKGIRTALEPSFRDALADLQNPYGDGHAADTIVERLRTIELDERLLIKSFHDLPEGTS